MTSGLWRIAHWKRIPIYAHWSLLIGLVWCWLRTHSVLWTLAVFAIFVGIMLIHEMGHAVAARLRRLYVVEIRLYLMHGLCVREATHREKDDVFVAWGGVAAQGVVLVLALATQFLFLKFAPATEHALRPLFDMLTLGNAVLIAINLLPIPPLDGFRAWRILRPLWSGIANRWRNGIASIRRARFVQRRRREMKRDAENKVVDLMERMKKK